MLTLEFVNSLKVKVNAYSEANLGHIQFQLVNCEFSMTLIEMNRVFGFSKDGLHRLPQSYHESNFWEEIVREREFLGFYIQLLWTT